MHARPACRFVPYYQVGTDRRGCNSREPVELTALNDYIYWILAWSNKAIRSCPYLRAVRLHQRAIADRSAAPIASIVLRRITLSPDTPMRPEWP